MNMPLAIPKPRPTTSATEEGVPDEIKEALFNPYAKHGQG